MGKVISFEGTAGAHFAPKASCGITAAQLASKVSYGIIFAAGMAVVLAVAVPAQLLALRWRSWFPGAEGEHSLFGGVRAAVYTFMSHLS